MSEVTIIATDLAKHVFLFHGAPRTDQSTLARDLRGVGCSRTWHGNSNAWSP